MPKRASRHQASRSSRVFIESRHHSTSGLFLEGRLKFSATGESFPTASARVGKSLNNATPRHRGSNKRKLREEDKNIIRQHAPQRGAATFIRVNAGVSRRIFSGFNNIYSARTDVRGYLFITLSALPNFKTMTVSIGSSGFSGSSITPLPP